MNVRGCVAGWRWNELTLALRKLVRRYGAELSILDEEFLFLSLWKQIYFTVDGFRDAEQRDLFRKELEGI